MTAGLAVEGASVLRDPLARTAALRRCVWALRGCVWLLCGCMWLPGPVAAALLGANCALLGPLVKGAV